jgi:ubiquinone/menaquinone biosynthesis methyltransferase
MPMSQTTQNDAVDLLLHKKKVPVTFDKIANRYNLATSLSQGYRIDLKRSVNLMNLKGDEYVLDLCCGTGKSTIYCLEALPQGKVLAIDNSVEMLRVARATLGEKYSAEKCQFLQQDIMNLDLPKNSVDAIFMAYGIRNMPDYEACLKNLQRILKPGGIMAIHEFSLPKGIFYRFYWRLLGYGLIIPFSALITGNVTIFAYLIKSVLTFLSPQQLSELLVKTGFSDVTFHSQRSWRRFILFTFIAHKSSE